MADVSVSIGKVESTYAVSVREMDGILYNAVFLRGEGTSFHLSTLHPEVIARGRSIVAALAKALDELEDAVLRARAVPIASLAPDLPPAA